MDAKRNLKFSKALFTSRQVSLSRGLKIARLYKRNVSGRVTLGLNSGRSVSLNVNKTRKHFSRNSHGAGMFPNVFQTLFPVSGFVFKMQIMLTLHGREF